MATFAIEDLSNQEPFKTSDGQEVVLHLRRLGRIAKVDAAMALSRGDAAGAESILLRHCVTGWSGVQDARKIEVKFSQEGLDALLGSDDELGRTVSDHLFAVNGLVAGGEKRARPLDPSSEPGST